MSDTDVINRRMLAGVIDIVVSWAILLLVVNLAEAFGWQTSEQTQYATYEEGAVSESLKGLVALIGLNLGYLFVMEALFGRTIGKVMMGLRVASIHGSLAWWQVAIRTVCRVVDGLPFLYLVGLVLVARSKRGQRIGDMLAGTIVIRTEPT
jgi:uncharacterized RDD family membrane protein YckC